MGAGVADRGTSLFRPSLLVTREIRYGLQDRITQRVFPIVAGLLPRRYHQVRVEVLEYPDFIRLLRAS